MSDNTTELVETPASTAEGTEAANPAKPEEAGKPVKPAKMLILPKSDDLDEAVQLLVLEDSARKALLAQIGAKATSIASLARRILRDLDMVDDSGKATGTTYKWTTGANATMADIAREIVPNPDKVVYRGKNTVERQSGQMPQSELDYCNAVDTVQNALTQAYRDASGKKRQKPQQQQAPQTPETDKSDKPVNFDISGITDETDMTDIMVGIARILTKVTELGNSVNASATAQNTLLDACRAYVAKVDELTKSVESDKPATPATAGRRGRTTTK